MSKVTLEGVMADVKGIFCRVQIDIITEEYFSKREPLIKKKGRLLKSVNNFYENGGIDTLRALREKLENLYNKELEMIDRISKSVDAPPCEGIRMNI